jgi:hypothetical protein
MNRNAIRERLQADVQAWIEKARLAFLAAGFTLAEADQAIGEVMKADIDRRKGLPVPEHPASWPELEPLPNPAKRPMFRARSKVKR